MRGARVVGVEIDAKLADKARAHCERLIVGDLDRLDLGRELDGQKFDVIICADILEHLIAPWRTLAQVRSLIAPGGFVVASIPNITHISVALELLKGNFDYRPLGLLDETHRRFFSKRGVIHLFERAGYWVSDIDRTYAAPHHMEIVQSLDAFSPELVRYVESHDDAVTYQFVVRAKPFSESADIARSNAELEKLRADQALLEPTVARARIDEAERIISELRSEIAQATTRERAIAWQLEVLKREKRPSRSFGMRLGRAFPTIPISRRQSAHPSKSSSSPQLIPVGLIRRSVDNVDEWQPTGDESYFRIAPPLPGGWAVIRVNGHASPPSRVALHLGRNGQTEDSSEDLGPLASTPVERYVSFRHVESARLSFSAGSKTVTIDEFELKSIRIWRLVPAALVAYVRRTGQQNPFVITKGAMTKVRQAGFSGLRRAIALEISNPRTATAPYEHRPERHSPDELAARQLRMAIAACRYQPTISLLLTLHAPEISLLTRCIDSIRGQLYPRWELCIATNTASADVRELLNGQVAQDSRIKVIRQGEEPIETGEPARGAASGHFVAVVGQHDQLSPDALAENVLLLNRSPDLDVIYSDEDRLDEAGTRSDPYFKPEWSPETLLGYMYLGRLCLYRAALLQGAGAIGDELSDGQEYDLALRITEKTSRVGHIPRVLYHSGAAPKTGPTHHPGSADGAEALERALVRRRLVGSVRSSTQYPKHYAVQLAPDRSRKVSVVIPTRDHADLLERCLGSVFGLTTYPDFDVCVVDNGSKERATFELFDRYTSANPERFHVTRRDVPFNFSTLVNAGVATTDGELIVMLNNDTEVIDSSWLEQLAGYAQRPEIGAVGCVLLYPSGSVQHGGVVLVAGAVAANSDVDQPADAPGYFGRLLGPFNCAAVTAACMMVRRELFIAAGGFDEELPVGYNDVDFCLRLLRRGYRNVCLGHVRLLHHGSASRGSDDAAENRQRALAEFDLMRRRWAVILDQDPYYSPNLRSAPPDFQPHVGSRR